MTAGSADLVYRGCTGFAILGAGFAAGFFLQSWLRAPSTSRKSKLLKSDSVVDLIGNTPLIRIKSLSEATGCEIYGKAEFTNPGGSVKDRVALQVSKVDPRPTQSVQFLLLHAFPSLTQANCLASPSVSRSWKRRFAVASSMPVEPSLKVLQVAPA